MPKALYLQQTKEAPLRRGHPWVFPKAILRQDSGIKTGELIALRSEAGEFLALGVYNEHSLYRVRVLAQAFECQEDSGFETLIQLRFEQAKKLRSALNLPNADNNAYRLFNSEADGLSGICIDRFDNLAVVSSTAYWVEQQRFAIESAIRRIFGLEQILWIPQVKTLAQDGCQAVAAEFPSAPLRILEAGVQLWVDLASKQKTGLYLDQRENHQRMATLAKGRRVLDLYTYTGGFALHAAKAGASAVTAVDSSAAAIALAEKNAALNQLSQIEFINADARDYLAKAGDYDLVILDPPKLVPSQRHLQKAKNYYRFLHREVFKVMQSGSLLLSCNCSAAISSADFVNLISQQALAVGKLTRVLAVFGPAACHPVLAAFPEGQYLTAVLLAVL